MSAVNVLLKTKQTIEKYGWVQGKFGSEHVGFCLRGALRWECPLGSALDDDTFKEYLKASKALDSACEAKLPPGTATVYPAGGKKSMLVEFNDNVATSKEDVLAVIDEAIELLKKEATQ